jgi:hypothetical protein
MGSSKKPKQGVAEYHLSIHVGVCHSADSILEVRYNEKEMWRGEQSSNYPIPINRDGLFGGPKKEGGVRGLMHVLLGGPTQLLDNTLATRLAGPGATGGTVPGFRGLTSLFFTGGGPESRAGFYWTANSGYLRPIDVKVRRAPGDWYPAKAMLPSLEDPPEINGGMVAEAIVDARGLSRDLDPSNTTDPNWDDNFSQTLGMGRYSYSLGDESKSYYTPPAGPSEYLPPGGYAPNPGSIYAWKLPATEYSLPFDYRWTLTLEWDGSDGLRWDNSWSSLNSCYQFPPNAPGCEIRFVGAGGSTVFYLKLQSITLPVGSVLGRTVQASWVCSRTGQSWSSPTSLSVSSWKISFVFNNGNFTLVTDADTPGYPGEPLSHTIGLSPKEIAAVRFTTLTGVRYQADTGTQFFGGHLRIDGINPVSNPQDANPAHIIYECLTNSDWGLGLPDAMLDQTSFISAADTLYDEGFGLSMAWSNQGTIESFVNDILSHIDGTYGIDPATGKVFIKLIRGGYSVPSLFEVNEDNAVVTRFQRKALGETMNEAVVTWTNPDSEKEETVVVHDLGNYAQQGSLVSNSSNYYGVRSRTLALRLAMRDLTRGAYPLASIEFEINRKGWGFKPGDVVKISYPEYGLVELPVRVGSVDYGRPGEMKVRVSAVEDVFEMPSTAYASSEGTAGITPEPAWPAPFSRYTIGSLPFYISAHEQGSEAALSLDVGEVYSCFVAGPDNQDTRSFDIHSEGTDPLGVTSYQFDSNLAVVGRAVLLTALVAENATGPVSLTGFHGADPVAANLVVIGDLSNQGELALITSTSPLTFQRGVLDTSPKKWPVGTPVWFVPVDQDLTSASTMASGSSANFKLLPITSLGTLTPDASPVVTAAFPARQHMPYRPANVKINGSYWPELVEGTTDLVVTFNRRNRITEEPVVLAWTAGDTTPEAGTTYTIRLYRVDTNALLTENTGIAGSTSTLTSSFSGMVRLEALAVRDGLSSFQPFTHVFDHAPGGIRTTETGDMRITEDGNFRALEA